MDILNRVGGARCRWGRRRPAVSRHHATRGRHHPGGRSITTSPFGCCGRRGPRAARRRSVHLERLGDELGAGGADGHVRPAGGGVTDRAGGARTRRRRSSITRSSWSTTSPISAPRGPPAVAWIEARSRACRCSNPGRTARSGSTSRQRPELQATRESPASTVARHPNRGGAHERLDPRTGRLRLGPLRPAPAPRRSAKPVRATWRRRSPSGQASS